MAEEIISVKVIVWLVIKVFLLITLNSRAQDHTQYLIGCPNYEMVEKIPTCDVTPFHILVQTLLHRRLT